MSKELSTFLASAYLLFFVIRLSYLALNALKTRNDETLSLLYMSSITLLPALFQSILWLRVTFTSPSKTQTLDKTSWLVGRIWMHRFILTFYSTILISVIVIGGYQQHLNKKAIKDSEETETTFNFNFMDRLAE